MSRLAALIAAVVTLAWMPTPATAQDFVITPTTTLAAETGNNTSTADTYVKSPNNNLGAGNVSKVDIRKLLYSGSTSGIYVHLMPWWGETSHINIGYKYLDYPPASSTDLDPQVTKQVDDMMSRGVQGAIIYWRGLSNKHHDNVVQYLRNEAERRDGNFKFAISLDGGSLGSCASSLTCNLTSTIITDLKYAYEKYEQSPAYLRFEGRPVVFFFDPDRYGTLNWDRIVDSVPGEPLFIFRNSGGFRTPVGIFSGVSRSSGSYAWIDVSATDPTIWGQAYLTNFYKTGMGVPLLHTIGAVYKGFNDSVSFGTFRLMNQDCGGTWLNTFGMINSTGFYSSSKQLESVRLVTWNDHEEGTALETGIDNCVYIGASLSGSTLQWNLVGGSEAKLDHYEVFISRDGQNLMKLAEPAVGSSSLDLSSYSLPQDTYTLHVKAVGKPTMSNRMSNAVRYTPGDVPPTVALSVTPTSGSAPLSVNASMTSADEDGSILSNSIDFGDGSVADGASASHTYAKPGQYRVTATAVDNANASSSHSVLVNATNSTPVASLSVSQTSGNAPLTINASAAASTDPDGTIATTRIEWGEGTPLNGVSGPHRYALAGPYVVRAIVIDNFGAFNRAQTTINVAGPQVTVTQPTANSMPTSPVHVVATALPGPSGSPIASFSVWDYRGGTAVRVFGPVATSTGSFVADVPLVPDEQHRLAVRATDAAGGSGQTIVQQLWVKNQAPNVALSVVPTSGIVPLSVTASTAGSTDADGKIVSSTIDFGDGTIFEGSSTTHTYTSVGDKTVKATLTDELGGVGTATQVVNVMYNFSGFLSPIDKTPFFAGATIPVKFGLTNANSATVSTAVATLQVFLVGPGNELTPVPVVSSGSSNNGTYFRFDPVQQQYIYDLSTTSYVRGKYVLQVSLDDDTTHQVQVAVH